MEPDEIPQNIDAEAVEQLARESGWVPEDEWEGDKPPKNGFTTAEQFLENSKYLFPKVRKENQELRKEVKELKQSTKELQQTARQFHDFTQQQITRERAAMEQRIQQLEAERVDAINTGDGARFQATEAEIQALRSQTAQQPAAPAASPEQERLLNEFIEKNPWYANDPVMRDWADAHAARLKAGGVPPGQPIMAAVAEEARRAFPDRFTPEQSGDARPGSVEGGGTPRNDYGRKTFDDLPNEAQEAYHRFRKLVPGLTKKDYLANYEWEQ